MNDQQPITQQPAEDEINLLDLLYTIVRRKRMIVSVTLAAAVIAVIYSLFMPNIYAASARILPPQKDGGGGGLTALIGQAGGLAGLAAGLGGFGGPAELYVGILRSRSLADAIIKKFDLAKTYKTKTPDDTRWVLAKTVQVQAGKDGIITITASDRNPQRAAQLANAFVDELGRATVRLNLTKAGADRLFLEKRLEVVKIDLRQAEETLKDFAQRNRTIQIDAQAKATIEGMAKLKAELVSREVQLEALRSYQTNESQEVKTLLVTVQKLRGQIASLAGTGGSGEGVPTIGSVPSLGLEYARRMRELKIQEAIFEQLTKQYEMAKLSEAKDSSTLQVIDEAVPPDRKSRPRRALIVLLTTVTAFFVMVIVAFVQEYLERISGEDRQFLDSIKREMFSLRNSPNRAG